MKSTHFDLIIANYELPQCNALEMAKALRATGNAIPIVLIAGTDEEEVDGSDSVNHQNHGVDEDKALTEDCQRYVRTILWRPFPPSDLLQVIVSIKREADLLHETTKVNDNDLTNVSIVAHQIVDLPQQDEAAPEDIVHQLIGSEEELCQH